MLHALLASRWLRSVPRASQTALLRPRPALGLGARTSVSVPTGKGERRRVRSFRKTFRPAADTRGVKIPDVIDDDSSRVPMDKLLPWLDSVEAGVRPMVDSNPGLLVTRDSPTSLTINAGEKGTFRIYLESDSRLAVHSPAKMGTLAHYQWDESREQFASILDGHNALELIARDLVTSLRGVPAF